VRSSLAMSDSNDVSIEENGNGSAAPEENEDISDINDISERIRQIEQEAQRIRELQNEYNSSASSGSGSPAMNVLSSEERAAIDNRSVFVGNVDYSAKPDQLEEHFRGCGAIERVTILADKFSGHPKGFAYIEFTEAEGKQNALALNESLFLGRQIKVMEKRTNKPGISTTNRPPRGRGRARMVVKYVYPGFRGGRPRSLRRRGFNPY